jgi:hypothetical protein
MTDPMQPAVPRAVIIPALNEAGNNRNRRAGKSKVSGTLRGAVLAARYILGVTLRYARP